MVTNVLCISTTLDNWLNCLINQTALLCYFALRNSTCKWRKKECYFQLRRWEKIRESRLAQRTQNHHCSEDPNQDSRDVTNDHHEDHRQNCSMHKTGSAVRGKSDFLNLKTLYYGIKSVAKVVSCCLHLIVAQNTAIITIVSLIFRCLFVNA